MAYKTGLIKQIFLFCIIYTLFFCKGFARQSPPAGISSVSDTAYIIVRNVVILGNKKTRTNVILRELGLAPGDTIHLRHLAETLEQKRKQLLNTSLFLNITVNVKNWQDNNADIVFEVWERWYTFPIPIFKLADRNFNQWWVEQGRSLDRVNVGVRLFQDNLTGRNDEVRAELQYGYTQRVALSYDLPYVDKSFRHGIGFIFSFSRNREINDSTAENKQHFYRQDEFIRRVYTMGVSYSYRKAINTRHQVFLTYNYEKVNDSVAIYNPNYFGGGRTMVHYLNLLYRISYTRADSWTYPLKGIMLQAEAEKMGLGGLSDIDHVRLRLRVARYWQLFYKTYGALGLRSQVKFPANQPYVDQKAIGYQDDYLRGLEYNVVDGTSYFIVKSTLRREMLNFRMKLPLVPKKFSALPFRVMAKIYGDAGYAYSQRYRYGLLNNRILYTGGIGFDIVSFYDSCLRIEYSINQLGQKGLFLHTKLDM
ncbi:Surface antigen variable number repeat-containing protein [Chitinophaga sp. CF118]|uniref:BamA/TamA family outer membrane protein n=1 Tax=Chitinophaga sp. CF118 TaxID=1884367 RepID=UPI0008EA2646|nr:BamA/TamA family outer membrane protein [Chitinophaga sp. CF118]SFE25087.1 Surface antigen variable number repeat-containing protein [Chitinophaga sp. CF118]